MIGDPRRRSDAVEGGRLLVLLLLVSIGVALQVFSISRTAEATGYAPGVSTQVARTDLRRPGPGSGSATAMTGASPFELLGGRRGVAFPSAHRAPVARLRAAPPARPFSRLRPARPTPASGLEPAASFTKRRIVISPRTAGGSAPGPLSDSIVAPDSPAANPRNDPAESTQSDSAGPQLLVLGPAVALRGDEVAYSIMVENVGSLAQAVLELVFDPDVLEFLEATEGPFLGSTDAGSQLQVRESSSPGSLQITITQAHSVGGDPRGGPAKGSSSMPASGLLCVVRLLAKGEGESGIRLTGSRLLDFAGQEARVSLNGIRVSVQP